MAGAIYGYARVSSRDQNLARQLNALEDFWGQLNTFCPDFVPIFKTEQKRSEPVRLPTCGFMVAGAGFEPTTFGL